MIDFPRGGSGERVQGVRTTPPPLPPSKWPAAFYLAGILHKKMWDKLKARRPGQYLTNAHSHAPGQWQPQAAALPLLGLISRRVKKCGLLL